MCIAVYKPEGITLYKSTLQNCWDNNDDGAGFMYAEKGKLHIQKGFFTFDEFMQAYKPHAKKQVVLHFRIRTHGDINVDNCHPYVVDDNLAFVHNGTIHDVQGDDKSMSDTWYFNEKFLKPMRLRDKSFFKHEEVQQLIKKYIGWSKLIFLNSKGESSIINPEAGNWDSGCWFSNTSWKTARYKPQATWTTPSKSEGSTIKHDTSLLGSGDVCFVASDGFGLKVGDYVVVKYVYADRTVGVYACNDPKKEARVPIWMVSKSSIKRQVETVKEPVFKKDDIAIFRHSFNHFRQFDDVVVKEVISNNLVQVLDETTNRTYKVPTKFLDLFGSTLQ